MATRPVAYCISCDEKTEYIVKACKRDIIVKGVAFSYVHQTAYCTKCGDELFVPEINDENVQSREDAYRKASGLITVSEVNQILNTYCIGAGPLAKVLGMGEIVINRYVGGQLPSKENSAHLLDILSSPQQMSYYLEKNKEKISGTAYRKCREALDRLLPIYGEQKIEIVTRYLLSKSSDITALALQKLLYYAQSFYYAFYGVELFNNPCQAWQHGPVYPEIYRLYKEYCADPLDQSFNMLTKNIHGLTENEMQFLDCIVETFGRYSGSTLRNITHRETPWKDARGDLSEDDRCSVELSRDSIHAYFAEALKKNDIRSPSDMRKYTSAMLRDTQMISKLPPL